MDSNKLIFIEQYFHTKRPSLNIYYIIPEGNPRGRSIQFECSMSTAIDV